MVEEKVYAGVIVNLDIPAADKVFHYRIPGNLLNVVNVGDQVLVPFQHRLISAYVVSRVKKPAVPRVKDIIRNISSQVLTKDRIKLAAWLALRYNCYLIEALRTVLPPGGGKKIRQRGKKFVYLKKPREDIEKFRESLEQRAPRQAQILSYLFEANTPVTASEVVDAIGCSPAPLRTLVEKKIIHIKEQRGIPGHSFNQDIFVSPSPQRLTPEQEHACKRIYPALDNKTACRFLLHGVTGSGKTEVYLRAIAKNLEYDRGAIVLVPEISLTPQMVARFRDRFGPRVAVLHSRLSLGERYEEWWRRRRGEAPIVIGARSAIFAPVPALGLIILDEEHDSSYKQDVDPRYQTREVAEFRSQGEGAVLILGSATPAVESYYRAQAGFYQLIFLSSRVDDRKMPDIELIDMRSEFEAGNRSFFSRNLQRSLGTVLKNREQVILFLNRRGFANFVLCRQCGYVALCPNCNVSLTFHEKSNSLRCHYCFYEMSVPSPCPQCGSKYIRHFGLGTQRVEAEIQKLFPKAKTLRMDADTTGGKDAHGELLAAFAGGSADVLIGTQMVTKGLDIAQVTLVGVISADTSLNFPDFRSGERTFQLLTQAAGRAGRGHKRGKVIIQTYTPEHYSIQAAYQQNYEAFYRREIRNRKRLHYPPFSQLISLVVSANDDKKAATAALQLAEMLRKELPSTCRLYGPGPAPLSKIRGRYRHQLVIKGTNLSRQAKLWVTLRKEFEMGPGRSGISLSFDIAPESLL